MAKSFKSKKFFLGVIILAILVPIFVFAQQPINIKPFGGITHFSHNDPFHGHYPMICCNGFVIEMDHVVTGPRYLFLPFFGANIYEFHQELSNGAWILGITQDNGTCHYGAYCRQSRTHPQIKLIGSSFPLPVY